ARRPPAAASGRRRAPEPRPAARPAGPMRPAGPTARIRTVGRTIRPIRRALIVRTGPTREPVECGAWRSRLGSVGSFADCKSLRTGRRNAPAHRSLAKGRGMTTTDELRTVIPRVVEAAAPSVVRIGRHGGRGCGVVVGEGLVLTNAHNLRDRTTEVTFAGGRAVQGRAAGVDLDGDLTVLRVDTGEAPPLPWAPVGGV